MLIKYIFLDKCTPNPCQNGGLCSKSGSSYICNCRHGYSGPVCLTSKEFFVMMNS